jgi:uncharacterized protein (TIGR03067 family)
MITNHRATMAVGILVSVLALAAGAADAKPPAPKDKSEIGKLQGAWAGDGLVWVITGDEVVEYRSAMGRTMTGKMRLDSTKKPKQMDLEFAATAKGRSSRPIHGIYEVKGETLRLCMASTFNPRTKTAVPRPERFESEVGVSRIWAFERCATVAADGVQIRKTFLQNEALAEKTYLHRTVKATGKIERVRRGGGGFEVLLTSKTTPLRFDFDDSVRDRLAKLKTGETVTIQGVCLGIAKRDAEDEAIIFVGGKIIESGSEPREKPEP